MRTYAPTYDVASGQQSAYDAGLSYFPDVPSYAPSPLGGWEDIIAPVIGFAVGGPGGATAGATIAGALLPALTGSRTDQERQAKANYFTQLALNDGNIAAVQVIMGAPYDVSGNERPYWEKALAIVQSQRPDVYQAAQALGPARFTGMGDTATNYPTAKAYVNDWSSTNQPVTHAVDTVTHAAGNIIDTVISAVTGRPTTQPTANGGAVVPQQRAGMSPVVLVGGLVAALALGAVAFRGKRR